MTLIDVRTPEEFAENHLETAINIPLDQIMSGQLGPLATLAKDTPLFLHCRSGARSGAACTYLQSAGYTKVTNLGSIDAARLSLVD